MPDDLLRYVIGPTPYSSAWLWLAVALSALLMAWYAGVVVLTMPRRRLRTLPVMGMARGRLLRYRFARSVRTIGDRYLAGELASVPAGEAVSHELRRFLHQATGVRAEYMQLDDIADGELSSAAPILASLDDARFDPESRVDVGRVSREAEELIRSWG